MTVDSRYFFAGYPRLSFGQKFDPQYRTKTAKSWNNDKQAAKRQFQPPPGVYRARDLIAMFGPLLDTCIRRVGRDRPEATRDVLIGGLSAILATSGRESSLALRNMGGSEQMRAEMIRQADNISAALVEYVKESLDYKNADPKFSMMSHCDGHLWTREVVGELMGARGDSVVMQLYNEWSHRIVLLRNGLMPFENWDEVPIVIEDNSRGMRMLETPSDSFVMRLLSGRLAQKNVVDMAKALTAPGLPSGGYGFQYSQGTVLPAFLNGSPSRSLLRYYPVREAGLPSSVIFEYEHASYEIAERSTLPQGTATPSAATGQSVAVAPVLKTYGLPNASGSKALLKLEFGLKERPESQISVCLGQIARGRRYASRVPRGGVGKSEAAETVFHDVESAFSLPGLVFSTSGAEQTPETLQVFPLVDPLLGLALFGKLYPGNVVDVGKGDQPSSAVGVGRGFGAKFVLWHKA